MKLIKWQFNQTLANKMKNPKFIWGSSALLGGFLYFKIWLPLTHIGIPCLFFTVTGHFCPGCGMTRAISALLTCQFQLAWQYNMLVYILPIVLVIHFKMKRLGLTKQAEMMLYFVILFVIAFGVLRNLSGFNYLAPPIK